MLIFERRCQPLLSRKLFAARVLAFLGLAAIIDAVAVAVGAFGFHFLEGLGWLKAALQSSLIMTGNGPIYPPRTEGGKLFTMFDALLGVIVFAIVTGVMLAPLFHRVLHSFHLRRSPVEPEASTADVDL